MSPWSEIAQQDTYWVPLAGWGAWEATRDLTALEPGVEVLVIESMSQEHRVRSATLLLSHTTEVVLEPQFEPVFDELTKAHCSRDASDLPRSGTGDALIARLRIAHRVLAHTPLCRALLRQAPLVTPHVTDAVVEDLTRNLELSTPVRDLVDDLRSGNDALALRALRNLAHLNKARRSSLLDALLSDGVLLHDALTLQERVASSSR